MDSVTVFDVEAGEAARGVVAQLRSLASVFAGLDRSVLTPSVVSELVLAGDAVRSLVECDAAQDAAALDRSGWLESCRGLRNVPGWVAASGRRRAVFPEFEAELVDAAARFCFEDFAVIVRHWMGLGCRSWTSCPVRRSSGAPTRRW